jgi:hypothetical protein
MSTPAMKPTGAVDRLAKVVLDNPLAGLAPWIVYNIVEGEGRLEISSALAFGLALAILMLNWYRGGTPKLLEYSDVVFFGALCVVVAVAPPDTHHWLERWSGEVANIALVVIALGSILIRNPFTLAYAKEEVEPEIWDNAVFLHTNYVLSWVWVGAFLIAALSGFYGDLVLDNPNNLWTGWIIQTLPMIVAAQFTIWYPKRVEALEAIEQGKAAELPPIGEFLGQVTPWISITGVVVLSAGDPTPWWVGAGLIAVGATLNRRFHAPEPEAA